MTPEEFVAAGDFLVLKCPTWQWMAGDPSKNKDYFPVTKQYLVTRNVPCLSRVAQMQDQVMKNEAQDEEGDDGFYLTGGVAGKSSANDQFIQDMDHTTEQFEITKITSKDEKSPQQIDDIPDLNDIPDLDDDLEGFGTVEEPVDPAMLAPATTDNILRTRTYDLSITYDKYYQT